MTPPEEGKSRSEGVLTSRRCTIFLVVVVVLGTVVSLTLGIVLHYELKDDESQPVRKTGVLVDCMPELRADVMLMGQKENVDLCKDRGCIWQKVEGNGAPWCSYPSNYGGYRMSAQPEEDEKTYKVDLSHQGHPAMFGGRTSPWPEVVVEAQLQTNNRLRVKISPKGSKRWEIPTEALNIESSADLSTNRTTALYDVRFVSEPVFGIVVTRKENNQTIFNSTTPGLYLSDQYLQLTTRLPSEKLYGFGEHKHETFLLDLHWKNWAIFTRDNAPVNDWNVYGHHPVYMNLESNGRANMVLLKNSNAMEVFLQPSPEPAVTYRTVGGVLDFYIFLGDSPSDVIKHYVNAIGLPVFPPYWSMGFHLSRWGYTGIDDMEAVINRTIEAQLPYEAQWADIDTFHKAYVFTYDTEGWRDFPQLVNRLKAGHRHFVTIVDPGIGANQTIVEEIQKVFPGYNMLQTGQDVFVKAADNATLIGEVWPGETAYPDFTHPDSQKWWKQWIDFYINTVGVKVEALWIDMNEPSSFVPGSTTGCAHNDLNYPPYVPAILGADQDGRMYDKTICMDAQHHWGAHYDVHSLYAHTMAMRTYQSLSEEFPGKRPWTMTRSSFVGTGHYATKWQGDNQAHWSNMKYSITHLFDFGMFGFPMTGADICGFWFEPSRELCIRWHQLGAFYPFARNHNGKGDPPTVFKPQDPAAWGQDFVDIVKPVLLTRQKFLPYLYTLLYRAHTYGDLVARPLLAEFPLDEKTHTIDEQFMLGPAFLISPVLREGAITVAAYFPAGTWFDYNMGEAVETEGETVNLFTPLTNYNLHVRAGYIVPWQDPAVTTHQSRQNPLGLLVALDKKGRAQGELFWDDGVSTVTDQNSLHVTFEMPKAGELRIVPSMSSGDQFSDLRLTTLEVYGLHRIPSYYYVNGNPVLFQNVQFFRNVLRLSVDVTIVGNVTTITWT